MNEAETRAEHIDPALKAAGWGVVEGSRIRRKYAIAPGRQAGYAAGAYPAKPKQKVTCNSLCYGLSA